MKTKHEGGTPLERGAALAVFLGFGGERRNHRSTPERRLGPVGDPRTAHRSDLARSDVYTLRRIVPKDRGFTWGDR